VPNAEVEKCKLNEAGSVIYEMKNLKKFAIGISHSDLKIIPA